MAAERKVLVTGTVLPMQRHRGVSLHGIVWGQQDHRTWRGEVGAMARDGDWEGYK